MFLQCVYCGGGVMKYLDKLDIIKNKLKNGLLKIQSYASKSFKVINSGIKFVGNRCINGYKKFMPVCKSGLLKGGSYIKKYSTAFFRVIKEKITVENAKKLINKLKGLLKKIDFKKLTKTVRGLFTKEKLSLAVKKVKAVFSKEKLKLAAAKLKRIFSKDGLYFAANKIRHFFKKLDLASIFKKVRAVFTKENLLKAAKKVRSVFTKKNLMLITNKLRAFFTKQNLKHIAKRIGEFFSKENLKSLALNIKGKFTKEKFKKHIASLKEKFSRENIKLGFVAFKNNLVTYKKTYITFIVLLLVIAVPAGIYISKSRAIPANSESKIIITDNAAEALYFKGQYDSAIEEYNKLASKDEREGLWYAKISEIYSVKGDLPKSEEYNEKAYKLGSNNAEVLNYITFNELMNKEYNTALTRGEEALKKFPKDKRLIKTMFTVYMANNSMDKAEQLVRNYAVTNTSAYDKAEYARMLIMIGDKQAGYSALKTAWFTDKDEYKVYDVLAQLSLYNRDELLEDITNLSEKEPDTIAYKMWLAKIYSLNESAAPEAQNILDEMQNEDTGKIVIKLIQAAVYQNTGQNDKAEALLSEVIEGNKDDYRVLHTAGWYYLNKGDYLKADDYCRQSIIKNKDYTDNYGFLMPEILKKRGKSDEGESYFRTALYKEPYNYNIMLTLADYYWHTAKDTEKALGYFRLAEIVMPKEPEIKYNMAFINITNNNTDEAVRLLKECISLSDDTPKYHRTLGTIYMLNSKPKEAIEEIRYAYAADQSDILTLNNAGCYYVTQDVNLVKGEYNLRKAVEGINDKTDETTANMIKENYQKAKDLLDKYNAGKSNETIKIPNFDFFY